MKVSELIIKLQKLESAGYGELEVFYRHGASGDCGRIGNPSLQNVVDECGPFDIEEGEEYIQLYIGN